MTVGDAELLEDLQKSVVLAAQPNARAGIDDGPLGRANLAENDRDRVVEIGRSGAAWPSFARIESGQLVGVDLRALDVDGNVDPAGAGASVRGEMKRLFQMIADRLRVP